MKRSGPDRQYTMEFRAAAVLEAVPVPVLILRAAGRIEFFNPTARRLLYRPGSCLQQSGDSIRRVGGWMPRR